MVKVVSRYATAWKIYLVTTIYCRPLAILKIMTTSTGFLRFLE